MSHRETENLPGTIAPVLSAQLLGRIQELNLDYLDLLTAEHEACDSSGQLQHLPTKLHTVIAALPSAARNMLAALPYTLYSLGFEDEKFWRTNCVPPAPEQKKVNERYAPAPMAGLQSSLCEMALLYAWHVATSNRLAARLVYAMPDATAQRLAAAPLWQIKRLALEHSNLLMPRWPTNPGFWPDLVQFAAANDIHRLATAKLLGSQLIAAELQAAACNGRGTAQSLLQSPRLRVRKVQFELRSR